jgi:hypothetical protein
MLLCALMSALVLGPVNAAAAPQKTVTTDTEARALREMAAAIPLGSRVKVQTQDGKRVDGTVMSVSADALIIKKRTRVPEPAITIPLAELARLELKTNEGMSIGKAIGIGVATGASAILTMFVFASALDD